jgi:hypothetical protein
VPFVIEFSGSGKPIIILSMPKRILRVVKWIGTTPAVGVCAACQRQFTLPVAALKNVVEARSKMQALFDEHACGPEDGDQPVAGPR